ncbi:hypothetical protein CBL_02530 [Carabus blaptoides fortunei]
MAREVAALASGAAQLLQSAYVRYVPTGRDHLRRITSTLRGRITTCRRCTGDLLPSVPYATTQTQRQVNEWCWDFMGQQKWDLSIECEYVYNQINLNFSGTNPANAVYSVIKSSNNTNTRKGAKHVTPSWRIRLIQMTESLRERIKSAGLVSDGGDKTKTKSFYSSIPTPLYGEPLETCCLRVGFPLPNTKTM